MRLIQLSLILVLAFTAVPVFGQYYMFEADENGVAIKYARAKEMDITAKGFGLTVKSNEHSGIYLGYAWAAEPNGPTVKSYTLGYERYIISNTGREFYPVFIPVIGINNTSYPHDLSVTSVTPGAAVGFIAPLWKTGRNVTAAGISLWVPVRSSEGLDPDTPTIAFVSSTFAFRMTPKLMLAGGLTYSDSNAEGSEGILEFKIGMLFATKMVDTD